ncbi:hypothetical protein EDB84DRAFT_1264774 [Lactarius hengduanensis]|nr:hypothetical protein EDB84DRAFT_1264774 [Lactarius hengduanensis]
MAGTFDPNQAQNLVDVGDLLCHSFAVKAIEHAQTYWKLLENIPPRELKFIRYNDEIFEHMLREFSEFATAPHTSLVVLDEDWMKGKEQWRAFINSC